MSEFLQGLICGGVASFLGCFIAGCHLHNKRMDEIDQLKESLAESRLEHAQSLKMDTAAISELRSENEQLNRDVRRLSSEHDRLKLISEGRSYELECKLRVIQAAVDGKVKMFDDGQVYVEPGDDE